MSLSFNSKEPLLEDYWRGIILLGRNVASYKFALAKALLELKPNAGELIKLGELAPTYAKHIAEHIKLSDKQITSSSSKFLDACRNYNSGEITENELTELTIQYGFNNVIDAFHVVGQGAIQKRFYIDERKDNKGIRISDEFTELLQTRQSVNLLEEVEARWRLVETAWELGVARSLVSIDYDRESQILFAVDRARRRTSVTGSRDALNGYQKGRCFYCFTHIEIGNDSSSYSEVDHFFPHTLKQQDFGAIIDGVWNLVLACKECNRGVRGKFAQVPTIKLLERLHKRNEYLISSHHPLRETLQLQTGVSSAQRTAFLNEFHNRSRVVLIHLWEPPDTDE